MKARAWGVHLPCYWGPVELSNVLKIGENGSALSFNNTQTTSPRALILVNMKECCSSASNKVQDVSHLTPRRLLFHRRGLSLRNVASTIPWKMMFYVTAISLETCFILSYLYKNVCITRDDMCNARELFSIRHFSSFLITWLSLYPSVVESNTVKSTSTKSGHFYF